MRNFLTIWFGQTASSVGSKMTGFAIGIWIFEQTGQATAFALTGIFAAIPTLILTLFSGIIVDRFQRKRLMMARCNPLRCSAWQKNSARYAPLQTTASTSPWNRPKC